MMLEKSPWNVVLAGVGGQGNVFASRVLARMLTVKGLWVTIGETFGATQRGGSVMSHVRVAEEEVLLSPQIPKGLADWVVALEPIEALRVLEGYGSPETRVLLNERPVYPLGVIAGEMDYPDPEALKADIKALSKEAFFLDTPAMAKGLGSPALSSAGLLGAFGAKSGVPFTTEDFGVALKGTLPQERLLPNILAFEKGMGV
jgi:indolepyruvate ferredoxin oxidoreductase beta subunit